MPHIKPIDDLGRDIWIHLAQNPADTPALGAAEDDIRAGTMTLEQAQAHPFASILVVED